MGNFNTPPRILFFKKETAALIIFQNRRQALVSLLAQENSATEQRLFLLPSVAKNFLEIQEITNHLLHNQ